MQKSEYRLIFVRTKPGLFLWMSKAIKLEDNYARGTIRISFGKENTFEEANIIAESLIRILKK